MLSQEEQAVLNFLATSRGAYFSAREICRKAGGKRLWDENQRWALPILSRLVDRGLVEQDNAGHYRLANSAREERR